MGFARAPIKPSKFFSFITRADGLQQASLTDTQQFALPKHEPNHCPYCEGQVYWVRGAEVGCASCNRVYGVLTKVKAK